MFLLNRIRKNSFISPMLDLIDYTLIFMRQIGVSLMVISFIQLSLKSRVLSFTMFIFVSGIFVLCGLVNAVSFIFLFLALAEFSVTN